MSRVVFLFALLTLVFAALFVADVQGYFNVARRPVAFLKAGDGTIRRLGMNQLTWDRASGGTLFGAGDTISTGEDSHAKLVFYAGGELELDAGAMVVLGDDLEQLKLNFLMGSGRVRVAKKAEGKIHVTRSPAAKAPARVASAARPAAPDAGAKPAAPAAEGMAMAELQDSQVEVAVVDDIPVPPEAPRQDLNAQPAGPAAAAKTAAAGSPSRATATAAPEPERPKAQALALAPAIQEKEVRHPAQTFSAQGEIVSVAELPPVPEIRFPARDAVISLNEGQVPKLQWELPSQAASRDPGKFSYEIILRPAEGRGEEKVLKSDQTSLSLSRIDRGKYLWSVRAIAPSGKRGPASEARWIEVKAPTQIGKPVVFPVQVE